MSWLTVIWAMCSAASFLMALLHGVLAVRGHRRSSNLLLVLIALGSALVSLNELLIFKSASIEELVPRLHWMHVYLCLLFAPIPWMLNLRFGTTHQTLRLLAFLGSAAWVLVIPLDLFQPFSLTYSAIQSLSFQESHLGETVTIIEGTRNPMSLVADAAVLLILAHAIWIVTHSIRTDWNRRAIILGGSLILFFVISLGHVPLVDAGILKTTTFIGPSLMMIVIAMSIEIVQDVVVGNRAMREAQWTEDHWESLLENLPLCVVELDSGRRIRRVNPHYCRVTGRPPEDFVGHRYGKAVPEAERIRLDHLIEEAFQGHLTEEATVIPLTHRDGTQRVVRWSSLLLRGHGNKVTGILSIGADLSDLLRVQKDLQQARVRLEQADRLSLLGELSAALAHEINQPLTAILANARAASRFIEAGDPDLTEIREILEDIVDDDRRAGDVINRLRDLIQPGPLELEPCDVHEIIRECVHLCQSEFETRGISVDLDLQASRSTVHAGLIELQQIVLNLFSNAWHAMADSDPRRISVSTTSDAEKLLVTVGDTGPGIPGAMLDSLFEPFASTRSDGLGMGLAISRRLLGLHGGSISARNRPNGGAEFLLCLSFNSSRCETQGDSLPGG